MTEYFIQLAQLAGIFLVIGLSVVFLLAGIFLVTGLTVVFLCWIADKVI